MFERKIGEPGEIGNSSQASSATNHYPESLRFLWFERKSLDATFVKCFLLGLAIVAIGVALWRVSVVLTFIFCLLGILCILLWVASELVNLYVFKYTREQFKNGLLTAAVVDAVEEPELLHIAPLSKGYGDIWFGILRTKHERFPKELLKIGQRIPCASGFLENLNAPNEPSSTWHTFSPIPVPFGFRSGPRLDACLRSVEDSTEDGDLFEILSAFVRKNDAKDTELVYVCDVDGNLIETRRLPTKRDLKEVPRTTPPPIPPDPPPIPSAPTQ